MRKTPRVLLPLLAAAVFPLAVSCGRYEPGPIGAAAAAPAKSAAPADVVVTVNGAPIGDADIRLKVKGDMHSSDDTPLARKNALDAIIRQELIRQRAVELGLEADSAYQQKLHQMEAQMNAFKRTELAEVFFRKAIAGKAEIGEVEAKKYFDENAERIRTELHIEQILRIGGVEAMDRDLRDLRQGTPFEEVAKRQFPGLPETPQKPWDLGFMKWSQLPENWRAVLDGLKPGQFSDIIHGPKNRSWIIRLVDKREDKDVTFESAKTAVIDSMKNAAIEQLREKTERELRDKAKIVYAPTPGGGAHPASGE